MPLTREERKLLHHKSKQPTFSVGEPKSKEGYDGDVTFRKVEGSGTVEYVKERGSWKAVASSGEMPTIKIYGGGGGGSSSSTGGGVTNHGDLSGLSNDDHNIYVLADGTRELTANWDAGSFTIQSDDIQADTSLSSVGTLDVNGVTTLDQTTINTADGTFAVSGANTIELESGSTITIGSDAVASKITVGGEIAVRTEVELNAILVDINAGTTGVKINSTGVIYLDSDTTSHFRMAANSASNRTFAIGATNAGSGTGTLDIDADGEIDILSEGDMFIETEGGMEIASAGSTNIRMSANSAGTKTFKIGAKNTGDGVGKLDLDADGDIDITAISTLDLDSAKLQIDSTDTTNISMSTNAAGNKTFSIDATNAGDGVAKLDLDADGDIDITSVGASNFSTSSGALTITSAAAAIWSTLAGNLTVDSAAGTLVLDGHIGVTIDASNSGDIEINVTAGDDIKIGNDAVAQSVLIGNSSATEVDLTAILVDINGGASGVTIDGGAASNFTTSAGAITIDSQASTVTVDGHKGVTVQSTNSGDITLDSVADIILSADGDQITMDDGTTTRFTFNVDSTPEIDVTGAFTIDGSSTIRLDAVSDIDLYVNAREVFKIDTSSHAYLHAPSQSLYKDYNLTIKASINHLTSGTADYAENYSWLGKHFKSTSYNTSYGT